MKVNFTRLHTLFCVFFALLVTMSCTKDGDTGAFDGDGIRVRVNLREGVMNDPNLLKQRASSANTKASTSDGIQRRIVDLGNDITLVAELVPEQASAALQTKQSASNGLRAAATPVRTDLPVGTNYRLLVYNTATGAEIHRQDVTVTPTSSTYTDIVLDALEDGNNTSTFTFVVYSFGQAALPSLPANSILNNVELTVAGAHNKLMYDLQTVTLSDSPHEGPHPLDLVLWNQLNEITTYIDLTSFGTPALKEISNPRFVSASHESGNRARLKLSDGNITYLGSAEDMTIPFDPIGSAGTTLAISTSPTVLVHDARTDGHLIIDYLAIEAESPGDNYDPDNPNATPPRLITVHPRIEFNDLAITPGVKYDLRLRLSKGNCIVRVDLREDAYSYAINTTPPNEPANRRTITGNGSTPSNNKGTVTTEYTVYGANDPNFGLVLDILQLDNSFNMTINGQTLAIPVPPSTGNAGGTAGEINFENVTNGIQRTVKFMDNYAESDWDNIWEVHGNDYGYGHIPVVRVAIDHNGDIKMWGRRNDSDPVLYEMELINGIQWNPNIIWHAGADNAVEIKQYRQGLTELDFVVYGRRLVDCTTGEIISPQ
ncbi:hypothetical protein [Sphingobacterium corticibacterium]|uniref:Uncharacterized protein n=1 Tax=Sphingobacterium corticibacterium TaxID=2484746 RepID=A0A4Q6XPN4_9SPHI|nr:hypothetical protein [Sphingobacterium corticibacterium]RZF61665.1 hypothetical protein EWE74_02145 [Sphingobacterium corticibacterium]